MKIQPDHLKILSAAIGQVRRDYPQATLQHYKDKNLTAKRWRWDLFHAADQVSLPDGFITKVLYAYLNDTHIDTALRHITSTGG